MPLTRSWDEKELLAPVIPTASPRAARRSELLWLIGASLVISAGLALVYFAKTQSFPDVSARLDRGEVLNLNSITRRDQLDPFFRVFPDPAERDSLAGSTFS